MGLGFEAGEEAAGGLDEGDFLLVLVGAGEVVLGRRSVFFGEKSGGLDYVLSATGSSLTLYFSASSPHNSHPTTPPPITSSSSHLSIFPCRYRICLALKSIVALSVLMYEA